MAMHRSGAVLGALSLVQHATSWRDTGRKTHTLSRKRRTVRKPISNFISLQEVIILGHAHVTHRIIPMH
jgi:hypothetical protein